MLKKSLYVALFCFPYFLKAQNKLLHDATPLTIQDSLLYKKQVAHKDFNTRITQFSSLSWVSPPAFDQGSEKGSYILSADIAPHFFIGGERMPFTIGITPRYKARIFRDNDKFGDSSLPVRTPSFMPGVTVYIPLNKFPFEVYNDVSFVSIAAFHHSNGQDGKTFNTPGNFNYYNGNFSTNFIELAYNFNNRKRKRTSKIAFDCKPNPEDCNQCLPKFPNGYIDKVWKVALEQHLGTAFAQRGTFSRTRLNLNYQYISVSNWRWLVNRKQMGSCYLKETYRIVISGSLNVDKLSKPYSSLERRINIEAGYYKRIAAGNTSVFVMGGYYGNDPYNIYYSKKYAFIRAGLALGFFVNGSKIRE